MTLSQALLEQVAATVDIDLVGVVSVVDAPHYSAFSTWLERGYAAGMAYLVRRREERVSVQALMPQADTVIMAGLVYKQPQAQVEAQYQASGVKIAQYAWGKDYHIVFKDKLVAMAEALQAQLGAFDYRAYVDTGPILERDYAALAGLGWIGKNTCLIHPKKGSFLFLGCLLTTLPRQSIPMATLPMHDHCGKCRACLDACPTGALVAPYTLDARKCISYWTIEHRGEFPEGLSTEAFENWIFGCDICQSVCPWNRKAPASPHPEFALSESVQSLSPAMIEEIKIPKDSPLRRTGRKGLVRNLNAIGRL